MTDEKTLYEQKIKGLENEISYLNNKVDWYRKLYHDYDELVGRHQILIEELMERLERSKV